MIINSDFCGGAIEVVEASASNNIRLNIRKDSQSCTRQWFYFSVETNSPERHFIKLMNANEVTFKESWENYEVFVSYDNEHWFTEKTELDGEVLSIDHQSSSTITYYAYFVPYTLKRQRFFLQDLTRQEHISISQLTETPLGNEIQLVTVGEVEPYKKNVWIIARQHPGETMAQWVCQGILCALAEQDEHSELLEKVTFSIVMNMNPDGAELGNHRTNANGANLNRCWSSDSIESCPEVFTVKSEMQKKGVDFLLDLHGDESIPHNFMMSFGKGEEGNLFKALLNHIEPNFQLEIDYNTYKTSCGSGGICGSSGCNSGKTATTYVADTYGATSLLLEASFKQIQSTLTLPTWDHLGCVELGNSLVKTMKTFLTR